MNDVRVLEQMLKIHRFADDLQIVGQFMPDAESVALVYYVPTGSRDEHNPNLGSISHAHMLGKVSVPPASAFRRGDETNTR